MRILCIATKSPWPPNDGGRLALWLTLQGLSVAGHEIALIAPCGTAAETRSGPAFDALRTVCTPHLVHAVKRSWPAAAAGALLRKQALTVARHHLLEVEQMVAELVSTWRPDVLHVEQLQALANCGAARSAHIPILLRMQNVESSLWQQVAMSRLRSRLMLLEARRLRANEASAVRSVTRTVALTERDAAALRRIGNTGSDRLGAVCPPFPTILPAGPALDSHPAIVLAGSTGWWPNTQGIDWFIKEVAPRLARTQPGTPIHVFGSAIAQASPSQPNVHWHPAPDDAMAVFPAGAIAAIPLHIGSGIRMRILEAWARGLPVVATSTAVTGLSVESGRELLIADTPVAFAEAVQALVRNPAQRAALVHAGRAYLARYHDVGILTRELVAQYQAARNANAK